MCRISIAAVVVGLVLSFTAAMAAEATAPQVATVEWRVQTYGSRTECRNEKYRGPDSDFESECLAATGGLAKRVVDQLVVRATDGALMGFADNRAACDGDDTSACKVVRLDSYDPARGFLVFENGFYEGDSFTYVDLRRKVVFDLEGAPAYSPHGDRFVVADDNLMNDPTADFAVYEIDDAGLHQRLRYRAAEFTPPRHEGWSFGRWEDEDHVVLLVELPNIEPKTEVILERGPSGIWALKDWPR